MTSPVEPPPFLSVLDAAVVEIEAHLGAKGWDQPPALFALVPTSVIAADPGGAGLLGIGPEDEIAADALTPLEQDALPSGPLDEALAGIEWPEPVRGCALAQEILILPPAAEATLTSPDAVGEAALHPDRREARLVIAVLRDGTSAGVLRLRGRGTDSGRSLLNTTHADNDGDDIAFGADLAPNLVEALRATLL